MEKKTKEYTRDQIDIWRQNIGKPIWAVGTASDPDLVIGIGKCTGIQERTGRFRLESYKHNAACGLEIGCLIIPRENAFLNDAEMSAFLTEWNKAKQSQYGFNAYGILRTSCNILIRPIRLTEDEWTGEPLAEFLTSDLDTDPTTEEDLLSRGWVLVKSMKFTDLSNAVLVAVHAAKELVKKEGETSSNDD